MAVPVIVEWHDVRPRLEIERYQHVVEGGINCPSRVLVLAGMTDYEPTAQRFSVKAGPLGIRVNMSSLDTISEDGLDGRDRYLIQIWPGQELSGPLVRKSWAERQMRWAVPYLVIIACIAFVGSLFAFIIALFPWSLIMLGIPLLILVCGAIARDRNR
jgi:hypothetical protein